MSKLVSNTLIITAMLVSLMGQAFAASAMASAMACEMAGESHSSHMMMSATMDHASMGHSGMTSDTGMADDCCKVACFCPTNACTSVTLLNTGNSATGVIKLSEAVIAQSTAQPNTISSSLFRPPIFA